MWDMNSVSTALPCFNESVFVAQLCPTLCDSMDCSLPGSSAHGILQARILEWVAIPFSRGIFPTQGSNPGLLHCRQILYHLSHQSSPLNYPWWCEQTQQCLHHPPSPHQDTGSTRRNPLYTLPSALLKPVGLAKNYILRLKRQTEMLH